ncbi:MAG: hypothetical protein CMQ24_15710, partial [Gammaproteobacteria bacterium]|nr:hypothetical protein [Gammaproteobacteria bacterium]
MVHESNGSLTAAVSGRHSELLGSGSTHSRTGHRRRRGSAQLAGIIKENPGLAGLVIGLANSAYFGVPSTVVTVRDA